MTACSTERSLQSTVKVCVEIRLRKKVGVRVGFGLRFGYFTGRSFQSTKGFGSGRTCMQLTKQDKEKDKKKAMKGRG